MLPKGLCIPLSSFNLDVNVDFVENPESIEIEDLEKEARVDDRSTKIATPNVYKNRAYNQSKESNTKVSYRSPNLKNIRKTPISKSKGGKELKPKEFNFEFKDSKTQKPQTLGSMKDRSQKKTAIANGQRIVQSKNSSKRKQSRETTKIRQKNTKDVSLADQIGVEFGNDNDMMSVGKQKLMLRRAEQERLRKEELQKKKI